MKQFLAPIIVVSIIALVMPFTAQAKILIGMPGPLTGEMAWFGEQMEQGMGMKVAELNEAGGVLGQRVEILPVDDYCDPEQAIAAARKLVAAHVAVVIGHLCSGAAIAASKLYEEAGILFFGSPATNPRLTDQGFRTIFRITGRDTLQGIMAADYLAERWADQNIAIIHDGGAYGEGVAEAARRRLRELGVREAVFEPIEPGRTDYFDLVDQLQAKNVKVLFFCGYYAEAALIIRQARSRGYGVRMIGPTPLIRNSSGGLRRRQAKACFSRPIVSFAMIPLRRRWSQNSARRVTSRKASPFRRIPQSRCGRRRWKRPARCSWMR